MTKVFIGLGSNLGQPEHQLTQAIERLSIVPEIDILQISPFYETLPVGYFNQPNFVNAVLMLSTSLCAFDVFSLLQQIELKQGRIRDTIKNGPRTIDLDLLLYGNESIKETDLIVPHPRMLERGFVLYPLYDLEPNCYIFKKIDWLEFQQNNPRPRQLEVITEGLI